MTKSILNHTGLLTFSSIDVLLSAFKDVSQEHEIRFSIHKKVLTVMIESLENVYKYRDLYESFVARKQEYMPTLNISMNENSIQLRTSNPVLTKDLDILKSKIDKVNNKSREELKELYVKTITNGEFSAKGGAGLGFIEMAKTSGNDLKYSFEEISEEFSLYTFIVTFGI
ncbi:MAG: SiaB family protein kinase [Bacteroidales bacterium]|nr:SiaB family protein kinase [Bacteroidales bacterium]